MSALKIQNNAWKEVRPTAPMGRIWNTGIPDPDLTIRIPALRRATEKWINIYEVQKY